MYTRSKTVTAFIKTLREMLVEALPAAPRCGYAFQHQTDAD
jgi:hypothetical protein